MARYEVRGARLHMALVVGGFLSHGGNNQGHVEVTQAHLLGP